MTFIDLFAGAGGLSEGFMRAGFEPIAHVEMDKAACNSLRTRTAYHYLKSTNDENIYVEYLKGKITRDQLYAAVPAELLDSIINLPISLETNKIIQKVIDFRLGGQEVDLIIGGPPCQAYSLVGRARSKDGMESDLRNHLYIQYAAFLRKYQPRMFVFENVLGLKSASKGHYLSDMEKVFKKAGYKMRLYTLEANKFGILQKRRRVVIIGWRDDKQYELPDLEAISSPGNFMVNCIFDDLPPLKAGSGMDKHTTYKSPTNAYLKQSAIRKGLKILTQHVTRPHTVQDKKTYSIAVRKWTRDGKRLDYNDLPEGLKTHNNRHSFFDRFKVVAADLPFSQTVVAHIAKDGHYYIHPDPEQNRSLSVREAARLQSFPDDYYFEGVKEGQNRTAAFKQIGNAVPPLMAYTIALELKKLLA